MTSYPIPAAKTTKAKAWVAGVVTVGMALTAVFADNVIGVGEVGTFVTLFVEAVAGVIAVYRVENKPVSK